MLTMNDQGKGLVKTYWKNVRARVAKASPEFAKIVDSLSPDDKFPLYLAYYPYGDFKGDTISSFLPTMDGNCYRITDKNAPKEVIRDLGYGSSSSPLGMLLENTLEYYIDMPKLNNTIPWQVLSPGAFFPLGRILQSKSHRVYSPNKLLSVVSGARSVFMLPKIGSEQNHILLQRDYNVTSPTPKSSYDHWSIFKEIVRNTSDCEWRSCVLYFSKEWVNRIDNDSAWSQIKKMLLEKAWQSYDYERNHISYQIAYSTIQYERNLKPNPYLVDTTCHLFAIALGAVPGYAPICNDELLPLELIQKAFVNSYGLKKYIPTIMGPKHFYLENKKNNPVYYSLQCPTTLSFSPKSRKMSSTVTEMRELKHIVNVFVSELTKDTNLLSDTIINEAAKKIEFNFYHNLPVSHNYINTATDILKYDKRFNHDHAHVYAADSTFACDAPFVRGCVSMMVKS